MKHSLLFILLFFSCTNTEQEVKGAIEQHIRDYAFRQNAKLETLEISALEITDAGDNYLDTMRILAALGRLGHYKEMMVLTADLAKAKAQQARLMAGISSELYHSYKDDAEEQIERARLYADSMQMFVVEDSIINARMTARKDDPPLYYKAKFLLRARMDDENILDTVVYLVRKNDMAAVWPELK